MKTCTSFNLTQVQLATQLVSSFILLGVFSVEHASSMVMEEGRKGGATGFLFSSQTSCGISTSQQ